MDESLTICYKEEISLEEEILIKGLKQHSKEQKNITPICFYAYLLKDKQSSIKGGIKGASFYGCLFIDYLWIDSSLRNLGWGKTLVKKAEEIAKKRKCLFISVTTMDWEGLPFYQKLGYEIEFVRDGFEKNSKMFILRKQI